MNPKSKADSSNTSNTEPLQIDQYLGDFQDAYNYVRTSFHTTWFDCYRLYNSRRVNIGYAGVNDAFIPETFTIIESLVANIAGGSPKFQFIPTYEEQNQDVEVLTNMVDYYWEANNMGIKAQQWVRDSLVYGNGILHVTWDANRNMPKIDNVPLRDFFVDPAATNLDNARYAGFRYLADKEKLRKMTVIDPETGKIVPKYNLKELDELANSGKIGEPLDKQKKEQLNGSTLGSQNTRQIEVILLYYMDTKKVVEIGNRTSIIREVDSPFQAAAKTQDIQTEVNGQMIDSKKTIPAIDCFLPFAILRDYVDSSLFFARGDVEVIMARQETLNDVENMDLDNTSFVNNVMWQVDPQYADMVPEIESIPGAVYPLPKNALSVIERPQITQDLDVKKQDIKQEMRSATAADEVIQGISQNQGRVTATEVSTQLSQSQTRFSTKLTNLESEGFAQLASIMFKLTQIFVDKDTAIRIAGPDGVTFKDFSPYDYYGWYEPHVKLHSTVERMDLEQGQKLNQMYQMLLGNQWVNQVEALRFIFTKLGAQQEDITRMLQNPTPAPLRPKVDVKLTGDMNPLQTQDVTSQEGFGGEKVAEAMNTNNVPLPVDGPGMPPVTVDSATSVAMAMQSEQQQQQPANINGNPAPIPGQQPQGPQIPAQQPVNSAQQLPGKMK